MINIPLLNHKSEERKKLSTNLKHLIFFFIQTQINWNRQILLSFNENLKIHGMQKKLPHRDNKKRPVIGPMAFGERKKLLFPKSVLSKV